MAATDYWVLVPSAKEMNVAGVVSDAFVVTTPQGSALDKQLLSNYTGKVTAGGKSGYLRAGPFTTLAAVQAYLKVGAQTAKTPVPGVNVTPGGQVVTSNPLTGLDAIGAFFSSLGEPNTWIRVAKVIVGGVLLIVGLVHITGADNAVASVARKVPLPV